VQEYMIICREIRPRFMQIKLSFEEFFLTARQNCNFPCVFIVRLVKKCPRIADARSRDDLFSRKNEDGARAKNLHETFHIGRPILEQHTSK
jgi:hypothetical protein